MGASRHLGLPSSVLTLIWALAAAREACHKSAAMQPPDPMLLHAFSLLQAGQPQQALALFQQLAARNDPGALATLAHLTWSGDLVPQSFPLGREYYHRAGEAGHEVSGFYATNLLASGLAGPRDWPEALRRLRREAARNPVRARILAKLASLVLTNDGDPVTPPRGEMLSENPQITLFRGAFSPAECAYFFEVEKPDFKRANVLDERDGSERPDPIRTSEESHIHWLIEDPLIHAFNRRLAAMSGTDVKQGEPLQILRYRPGQQYRAHLDYIAGAANQRVKTALLYLNQDYGGGETAFPSVGLTVKGRIGDVLLFRNALDDGKVDKRSEHAGLPVLEGVKLIATRWIREREHIV